MALNHATLQIYRWLRLIMGVVMVGLWSGLVQASEFNPIDWQVLYEREGIVSRDLHHWPFSPSEIELSKGETVSVLNYTQRLLRIQFIAATNEQDESVLPEAHLQALVSESPGVAAHFRFNQYSPELPQATQHRVVTLTNTEFERIRFTVLEGEPADYNHFAPLSWIDDADNSGAHRKAEHETDKQQTKDRAEGVLTHFNDHHYHYWRSSQEHNVLPLEKNQLYWQESMMHTSARWSFARNQLWTWFAHDDLEQEVITYGNTSRKVIVTDIDVPETYSEDYSDIYTDAAATPLQAMLPQLFSVKESGNWSVDSDGNDLFRVQSVQADWLFDDNYQTYSQPAVQQIQEEQALTRRLFALAKNTDPKGTPVERLTGAAQRSAINRQLVNKTLPSINENMARVFLTAEHSVWEFDEADRPDLWRQDQPVSVVSSTAAFLQVMQEKPKTWIKPDDILSNELSLAVHWPANIGELVVYVDGAEYQRLSPFSELPQYVRKTDWQRPVTTDDIKDVATIRLFMPLNWQNVTIKALNSEPLVRLRYKAVRKLQLDGTQWLRLLSSGRASETVARFKKKASQWLLFQQYLHFKSTEYKAFELPEMWQQLLQRGEAVQGLFDGHIPASLLPYQRILENLQQPRISSWDYWQTLAQALRQAGWDNHAGAMMRAVLMLHQQKAIQQHAANWLLNLYTEKQNEVASTSLLIYLHQANLTDTSTNQTPSGEQPTSDTHARQLASWFLQQNQPQRALFVLLDMPDSEARSALIHQAANRLGFVSLAKAWSLDKTGNDAQTNDIAGNGMHTDNGKTLQKTTVAIHAISTINAQNQIRLRNLSQDLVQTNYLVSPGSPVRILVNNAASFDLLVRQWFPSDVANTSKSQNDITPGHDWLSVNVDGERKTVPIFYSGYRSPTLVHPDGAAGQAHRMTLAMPAAGIIELQAHRYPMIVNISQWLPASHIQQQSTSCYRQLTQYPVRGWWHASEQDAEKTYDDFVCSQRVYQTAQHRQFEVVSDDGWSRMPDGTQILTLLESFEAKADSENLDKTALARLNQLANQWPESTAKVRLLRRINQRTQWRPLSNPIKVKKYNLYIAKTNDPVSPAAYRSRLLFTPHRAGWEKISANTALNYQLRVAPDQEFRILLEAQQHLFVAANPLPSVISVKANADVIREVSLQMGEAIILPIELSHGEHYISLLQTSDNPLDSVIAKLQFRQNNGAWQEQPLSLRFRLFQADEQQPYEIFLPEAAWLRVDSFTDEGLAHHEYRYAPQGMFRWYPDSTEYIGHRIHQLVVKPAPEYVPDLASESDTKFEKRTSMVGFQVEPLHSHGQNLDGQSGHSWGLWFNKQQRNSPDEESLQNNRYLEIGAYSQSRQWDLNEAIRYQLSTRLYDGEFNDSYHARAEWWRTDWLDNTDVNLGLSFAGQKAQLNREFAWSAQLRGNLHWDYAIDRRFFNRFSAQAWVNLIDSGKDPQQYANAVYSQYKLDHRHGIRVSESMRFKWHHDLESWFNVQLNSNPLGQTELLDNGVAELGSRVFYQGVAVDLSWRYQIFTNDEDRNRSINDSRLGIGFDWFYWRTNQHLRWRLGYERNLLSDENYWNLSFSYNRSGYRGVRDYLPQTMSFSALRQQEAVLTAQDPGD